MSKDLTNSSVDRKNILNNNIAIQEIYKQVCFYGISFEVKYRFTKQKVAHFFEVDIRTIERILENHKAELEVNGYELYTGSRLKKYKEAVADFFKSSASNRTESDVPEIHVGDMSQTIENELDSLSKTPQLAVFTYKSFLNIGMLLTGSEKARQLRSSILDIVIDVLNKKIGGKTKFVNQREEEFLPSAIREYNYRQEFTNALGRGQHFIT